MNYDEVIKALFSRRAVFSCLENRSSRLFAEALGHPERAYPTVHVAGTNGKGSVSLKIAKALEFSGLKVGLFTSPHLFCYTERIVVNGKPIPKQVVREKLTYLFALAEKVDPAACFFELTTILAFDYFREEKVDIAVIEAGIGGLYDSTNIITPEVSIITSISKDHDNVLGTTLEEIAFQKAGIIKPQVPVVVGPYADYPIIHEVAKSNQSPLFTTDKVKGFYDLENQAVAKTALQLLGTDYDATAHGLPFRPSCRFEEVGRVILDVAHNPDGINRLLEAMEFYFPGEPFSCIIGMSVDKDLESSLRPLTEKASHIFLISAATPRAAKTADMKQILEKLSFHRFTVGESIEDVLSLALAQKERVVVCGTFYIMQMVRNFLQQPKVVV